MRAVLFAVAIVALVAGLATPGVALGGSIKGTVVLKGATPELRKLAVTIDQYVCGKEKSPEDLLVSPQGRIRNAVVWLDKAPAGSAGEALPSTTTIDQKDCSFAPRVVIVPARGRDDLFDSEPLPPQPPHHPHGHTPLHQAPAEGG